MEGQVADGGDAGGDGDVGQGGAAEERGVADGGDVGGNGVTAGLPARASDKRRLRLVEQNSVEAAVVGIGGIDGDAGQGVAIGERVFADGGDAVGDRHAGQGGAAEERPVADGGDAGGDRRAGQGDAVEERPVADGGDAGGDDQVDHGGAAVKGFVADGGDGVAAEGVGNLDGIVGAGVVGDGDLAVFDGVGVRTFGHFMSPYLPNVTPSPVFRPRPRGMKIRCEALFDSLNPCCLPRPSPV